MESHPVPQNVTSFEFHLVGDMTLKQFAYLASGLIIAYIVFISMFNSLPIVATPITVLSSAIGAAFAFLPIYNRPLDHWVMAFFQAIFSPTQRIWRTPADKPIPNDIRDQLVKSRLQIFMQQTAPISTLPAQPKLNNNSLINLRRLAPQPTSPNYPKPLINQPHTPAQPPQNPQAVKPSTAANQPTVSIPLPSPEELQHLITLAQQAQKLQDRTTELEQELAQLKNVNLLTPKQVFAPAPPALNLKAATTAPVFKTAGTQPAQKIGQTVVIQPSKPVKKEIVLTSLPNIINGITTDSEGNYLENVIVIIHNQDNLPVRALKTNKLGQFTGATPLPSGIYTVTLEKDGYQFDTLQTTLSNAVLAPIKIIARKAN